MVDSVRVALAWKAKASRFEAVSQAMWSFPPAFGLLRELIPAMQATRAWSKRPGLIPPKEPELVRVQPPHRSSLKSKKHEQLL